MDLLQYILILVADPSSKKVAAVNIFKFGFNHRSSNLNACKAY